MRLRDFVSSIPRRARVLLGIHLTSQLNTRYSLNLPAYAPAASVTLDVIGLIVRWHNTCAETQFIGEVCHFFNDKEVKTYKMSKKFLCSTLALVAVLAFGSAAFAQVVTTTKKTTAVQNPDGTWTVVQYPVGKEVMINLAPGTTIAGAKGMAHVIRSADGTRVAFDLSGITGDTSNIYAYAVDPSGVPTLLGPLTVTNGIAKAEFTTPMDQFMLVLSPEQSLTAIDTSTPVFFRSDVPTGYAVVPRRMTSESKSVATAELADSTYDVPLLNVPSFKGDQEVRVKFGGDLAGVDGKAYINPKGGKSQIKMRFGDLKKAPPNTRFVLWAKGADGTYTKLGQVVNTGKGDEGEIRGETALRDFGLFLTVEDADTPSPRGRVYSVFSLPTTNP